MVSSASRYASEACVEVLKAGGNAVDAAVATALALSVAAPAFSGVGGGGFMLVHLAATRESHIVDYRETAPKLATPDMFRVGADGNVEGSENMMGYKAPGVPGSLAAMALALERFGTMPLSEVLKPAIRYAREGFVVGPFLGWVMDDNVDRAVDKFRGNAAAGKAMLKPDGSTYAVGETLILKDQGDTLDRVSRNGIGEFYEGFVAESLDRDMAANGGLLRKDDLREYRPQMRVPLGGSFKDIQLVTACPPSSGGIALIQLLRILEDQDLKSKGHNSAETIDLMAKVLASVYAERRHVADPGFESIPTDDLISDQKIRSLASASLEGKPPGGSSPSDRSQTSHLSVLDGAGNAVAATESLECFFGSGVMIPGTGVFLNDTMHDFDPVPGGINSVQPGKRPMSSMSPTIFLKDGRPLLVIGSAAGPRIITAVLQVVLNVLEHGMDIQAAIEAPRFHHQGGGDRMIMMESRISAGVRADLEGRGYRVDVLEDFTYAFGGVHAVLADDGVLKGGADPRRDGVAVGF